VQAVAPEATREDAEKRQALWWYLLLAGMLFGQGGKALG